MSDERPNEEISDDLTVKLIHFQEVTQIESLDRCRTILEQHDWDVERAVRTTLTDPNDPGVTPNLPPTPQGSYKDAQEEAKKQIRFLLLYIHNEDCVDTEPFCEATLCHPESIEYINRNMIFWACSIHKPEGYRVSRVLRGPTYPAMAVICSVHNRMTVVGKLEGKSTSEELIARLSEVVESYEPTLVAIRAEKMALNMNQKIRQEQDEAYQQCLRQDQEKMDKKKREEEEVLKIKERKEKRKNDKVLAKQRWLERKDNCRKELGEEPTIDANEVVLLKIKLPNGTRLTRRFLSTDSVKVLHDYVYSQEDSPPRFQIFSNFPRRCIPGCSTDEVDAASKDLPTLRDAGLLRSETLNIQEVLNDESSSSASEESSGSEEEER